MSADDDPGKAFEKLLAAPALPQLPPMIEPPLRLGNPKGSIGGVRNPIVRLGLVLALVGAIVFAILWWVL